ncbi:mitogen-activated protein kinase kinase kinase YODA isoform X1 [Lycium barbarum]|uniref:mitogen-activated protein kinase kinase kinase YODA isoform X1 n=1 Tax=Lycium barbarum TaxID=112863 RepID=UPI00293E9553|nr:mitogen-activated protein kinase kinase kinase YODA isoform X1 [Lycium barbarum]XP_060207070.1 mitogen-activated protein kinase kinase kinase YODA isoform X1 [Lycium barbarum]XP_060207071.1 mitogen-activated protein kinase kinase kinase YODA isoform X1 [Lycium barbarum]XP_060207072.1 mitogen-activated protein kinase kinase kinase YODA isoform X1 [Lycium barbarum]XP_060207073.1 mitogen-activated protein kinase kinase kinase YODA isoform X1 [Lycium barbarum]XP_060207074.1 mitogen-activated pr
MRSWWGKSSSEDARRKSNKENFIDTIKRKLKIFTEEKSSGKSGSSRSRHNDTILVKGSQSRVSRSPSPSTPVPRSLGFADRTSSQPLPLPEGHSSYVHLIDSDNSASVISQTGEVSKQSLTLPLLTPRLPHGPAAAGVDRDLPTASFSFDSSSDSDDLTDSQLLSPQTSDYENGSRTALNSPSSLKQKVQSPIASKESSGEMLKSSNLLSDNQAIPTSPRQRLLSSYVPDLKIPRHGAFYSAPDSSMSSPSRSPMRVFGHEPVISSGFWLGKPHGDITFLGSGHCSSPGSGQNSGHNSIVGDMSGQPFWPLSRCSPECSPVPSPRMTSPGPGSRIHSGAVTPLHPRASGASAESSTASLDNGKQQSHRLPLPPISIPHSSGFSPAYSMAPAIPRSPGRTGNPPTPGPRWKKGRLIGRGTFGHVYLGFNSESGEMCAMKEVTLFSNDVKSRESAQQLGQEISLLSQLRHPNIVQYYGSETVDDKLYIYLEYVSGGSIYKILQEYGQLGELAIQSYTQQILSGLAYLHAKNTVHRDIKGANILVDPDGRVKLADFGMAKHITGQYCPLSFKGSPYWMAPEVIKNSNGCHLAVDIWSLGCTVLEMATTKPPWSQYEGVAAIFKIGNSKELPAIPYHLSDEGKDFVRQCLQRNPLHRPTASQLLEHPFVKSAAPVERAILSSDPVETVGVGHLKSPPYMDSGGVAVHHQPRGSKILPGFSDLPFPRNISCPVSPVGIESPVLHSQSPKHMSGRLSPSTISSPHAVSGSSTPLSGSGGAVPLFNSMMPTTYSPEGVGTSPRAQSCFYPDGYTSHGLKSDMFRGTSQSHLIRETLPSDNGFVGDKFGGHAQSGVNGQPYQGQSVLANRVAQQLLRDQVNLIQSFDLNPGSPVFGRDNGV